MEYLLAPEQRTATLFLQICTNLSLCVAYILLGNIEFLSDSYKKGFILTLQKSKQICGLDEEVV